MVEGVSAVIMRESVGAVAKKGDGGKTREKKKWWQKLTFFPTLQGNELII